MFYSDQNYSVTIEGMWFPNNTQVCYYLNVGYSNIMKNARKKKQTFVEYVAEEYGERIRNDVAYKAAVDKFLYGKELT